MSGPQRMGMLGGAFDPPHLAHQALAACAVRELALDELRIFPTGQAWHKARPLTEATHRVAMSRLAFANLPQAVVDQRETRRVGPTYTLDTLRELRAEQPDAELFLLLGQDQAQALPSWHAWLEIVRLAIICVATRPANSADSSGNVESAFLAPADLAPRFRSLPMPPWRLSATEIRRRVELGQEAASLVGPDVARYIATHHLYQSA